MTETRPVGWLSRTLQRLTADEQTIDAEVLRAESASAGCEPLSSCRKGAVVTVTGRLKSVVYTPRETVPTLEAELFDGSGSVTLVWLGRRRIPGIEPGRTLTARGLIAEDGTDPDTGGVLYRTTELFLDRLGPSDLAELPSLGPLLPDMIDTKLRDLARTGTVVRVERDRGTMRWLAAAALVVAGVLVGAALG